MRGLTIEQIQSMLDVLPPVTRYKSGEVVNVHPSEREPYGLLGHRDQRIENTLHTFYSFQKVMVGGVYTWEML